MKAVLLIGVNNFGFMMARKLNELGHQIMAVDRNESRITVKTYSDLTVDFAKREKADFIVKGVRTAKDFEYEREQADINRRLGDIETLLLFAEPGLDSISSTLVRELQSMGRDVSEFLPSL